MKFTKEELYSIEKHVDNQYSTLLQLADKLAHNLIIAESNEEKHKDKIKTLKEGFKEVQNFISISVSIRKKCERERLKE